MSPVHKKKKTTPGCVFYEHKFCIYPSTICFAAVLWIAGPNHVWHRESMWKGVFFWLPQLKKYIWNWLIQSWLDNKEVLTNRMKEKQSNYHMTPPTGRQRPYWRTSLNDMAFSDEKKMTKARIKSLYSLDYKQSWLSEEMKNRWWKQMLSKYWCLISCLFMKYHLVLDINK